MSQVCSGGSDGQATRRNAAALRAADGLDLAASPTFASMALLTGVLGGGPAEMLCSAPHVSLLSGMVTMYLEPFRFCPHARRGLYGHNIVAERSEPSRIAARACSYVQSQQTLPSGDEIRQHGMNRLGVNAFIAGGQLDGPCVVTASSRYPPPVTLRR